MFLARDDTVLVKIALSRGLVVEDEVRECRYLKKRSPDTSVISILRGKGYLSENGFIDLLKIHSGRELRRAVKEYVNLTPEAFSSRIAKALMEAEVTFAERLRGRRAGRPAADADTSVGSTLICAGCGTRYETSKLEAGSRYKCRKCGNTIEVPDYEVSEDSDPGVDLLEALDVVDLVGDVVGGCKVMERIGEGGMGVVYRGRHLTLERDVAIKVLPRRMTSDFFRKRFLAESRAAAKLIHPNVVQIFDAGEHKGNPYIVMEYVEGATVKQLINTRKRLGLAFVIRVVCEAAGGLGAAHKLKLVHCDVKPENLIISFTGETKVMDFGLARDVGMKGDSPASDMVMGTPHYMAPEQFVTELTVDHRADIYALGVTLYHMLAGKPPFVGESAYKIMKAHVSGRYQPVREINAEVPEDLETLLAKMMCKDREKRYQTMAVVISDLERIKLTDKSDEQ